MFTTALSEQTRQVLKSLIDSKVLEGFYLAGGTALALQLGFPPCAHHALFNYDQIL